MRNSDEKKKLFDTADFLKWQIKTGFESILNYNDIPSVVWESVSK